MRPSALAAGVLALCAACGGGEVLDRPIALTGQADCTVARVSELGSLAVEAWGVDAQGDRCTRARACFPVAAQNLDGLLADLAAAPQPLLDLEAGAAGKIAVVGFRDSACGGGDGGPRACGQADLIVGDEGALPIAMDCELTMLDMRCDDYQPKPACP